MTAEGFGQAYSAGFEITIRFLSSRGLERDQACEIAQAAWVRGLERLTQLRDDRCLVTWVNTIALNFHRKFVRGNRLTSRAESHDDHQVSTIDLAAIDVRCLLARCSRSGRQLLREQMSGVTSAEIAERRGLTPTAVRIRMMRARREARAKLQSADPLLRRAC